MKRNSLLLTGLRLIAILNILYLKDSNKEEIRQVLKDKYEFEEVSFETLKLDINSLIKKGFKIKRGNRTNNYRYILEKDFSLFKLNDFESVIMNLIKEIVVATSDFNDVVCFKRFYFKIKEIFSDKYRDEILDFKHFNFLNSEILEKIDYLISLSLLSKIVYKDENLKKEKFVYIEKISYRENKLYINCIEDKTGRTITLRVDKIISVEILKDKINPIKKKKPKNFVYKIEKDFYLNNPIKTFEKVISFDKNGVYVEVGDENKFFVIQRILLLGENCLEIKDKELKREVIENIRAIRKVYLSK